MSYLPAGIPMKVKRPCESVREVLTVELESFTSSTRALSTGLLFGSYTTPSIRLTIAGEFGRTKLTNAVRASVDIKSEGRTVLMFPSDLKLGDNHIIKNYIAGAQNMKDIGNKEVTMFDPIWIF